MLMKAVLIRFMMVHFKCTGVHESFCVGEGWKASMSSIFHCVDLIWSGSYGCHKQNRLLRFVFFVLQIVFKVVLHVLLKTRA